MSAQIINYWQVRTYIFPIRISAPTMGILQVSDRDLWPFPGQLTDLGIVRIMRKTKTGDFHERILRIHSQSRW